MADSFDSLLPTGHVEVKLDGLSVEIPSERRSFISIRCYLDFLALQQQRVLCSLTVDGEPANLTDPVGESKPFARIEAETMGLSEVPLQLIRAALQQAMQARDQVQATVALVLINEPARGRELWWSLATALKEPLLTLSLLPENICGPANSGASLLQLRQWQLQQLGCVIKDVDAVCRFGDNIALSNALEKRVLPWLDNLHESLQMWHDHIAAGIPTDCPRV